MVSFPLTPHAYKELISRFLDSVALPPPVVKLLGRWFTASHNRSYMLVEADQPAQLFRYVSQWNDIMDFEIDPVLTDEEAAAVLKEMSQ